MPQVRGPEIKERAARLRGLGDRVLGEHLEAQVGRIHRVLTEGPGLGRTEGFAEVSFGADQPEGTILEVRIAGQDGARLLA
jgi:threonylcarbamoyladenosine tRNA methylthiotransferase MtaB